MGTRAGFRVRLGRSRPTIAPATSSPLAYVGCAAIDVWDLDPGLTIRTTLDAARVYTTSQEDLNVQQDAELRRGRLPRALWRKPALNLPATQACRRPG